MISSRPGIYETGDWLVYTYYENNKEGTTETVYVYECLFNGYEIETKRAIVIITVHI